MEQHRHLPEANQTNQRLRLRVQSYLFDPTPNFPLLVHTKRYWDPATTCADPDALTLIFSHGAGLPKETWEACIQDLFVQLRGTNVKINDMWCIDAPNHGEASWLNEQVLDWCYRPVFRQEDYAHAIHALISGLGTGVDVDFRKRRLVAVGHSMGTVSLMLTTTIQPVPRWSGIILVEPLLYPRGPQSLDVQALLVNSVKKKKDTWASVAEAKKDLLSKAQWRAWDPRALDAFLQHGLRPTDDARHPQGAVTLATSRENEAACLNDCNGATRGYRFLPSLVSRVPTHLIYGTAPGFISKEVRNDILHNASGGVDRLASFSLVDNAGHMVNITHPKQLAAKLVDALNLTVSQPSPLDPYVSMPKTKL